MLLLIVNFLVWSAMIGGVLSFLCLIVVIALHPQNERALRIRLAGCLIGCIGILPVLGASQEAIKQNHWNWHDVRLLPGSILMLVGGITFVCSLRVKTHASASAATTLPLYSRDSSAFTRHAQLSIFGSIVAALAGILCVIACLHTFGSEILDNTWLVVLIFFLPSILVTIVSFCLAPRCPSCGKSRTRLRGGSPVTYRCPSCGYQCRTNLYLGNQKHNDF